MDDLTGSPSRPSLDARIDQLIGSSVEPHNTTTIHTTPNSTSTPMTSSDRVSVPRGKETTRIVIANKNVALASFPYFSGL